jgi:hypothetical protein
MSYNPAIGRFLQLDPIGYDDGMNPYQFVGSNPVRFVDPMGTWKIERKRTSNWAFARAEDGDTWTTLAEHTGLDAAEYRLWVSLANPFLRNTKVGEMPEPGCDYLIPNVVYWSLGEDWPAPNITDPEQRKKARYDTLMEFSSQARQYMKRYTAQGYHVVREDDPRKALAQPDIAIWVFSGHGNQTGWDRGNHVFDGRVNTAIQVGAPNARQPVGDYAMGAEMLAGFLHHRLAEVVIGACGTDNDEWWRLVAPGSKAITYSGMIDGFPETGAVQTGGN